MTQNQRRTARCRTRARTAFSMALFALAFSLFVAPPGLAQYDCEAEFHCHDGGRRFRRIAEFIVDEMKQNSKEMRSYANTPGVLLPNVLTMFALSVCPECRWDHKKPILDLSGAEHADIPGHDRDLFLDAWSNIHFGYVGRQAGITAFMLENGADAIDLGSHFRTYESDRKWVDLGIRMYDRYRDERQLTVEILEREMLALVPEVAALPCDEEKRSIRPILKNTASNPLLASDRPKVMLVGDSITHGQSGDFTWRYRLHDHLRWNTRGHDFVGPFRGPMEPNLEGDARRIGTYRVGGWDDEHDATWGRALGYEQAAIEAFVRSTQPDLIVVHLGTNDLTWYSSAELNAEGNADRVATHMRGFIENARRAKPDVDFLLVKIGATKWLEDRGQPGPYNARLEGVAYEMRTDNSCVHVADVQSGWDWRRDTWDQTHPNTRGEYVIAKAVADELYARWGWGAPFGAIPASAGPYNITPTGLSATPNVVAMNAPVTFTWNRVANDVWTEYRIEIRTHKEFGFMPIWRGPNTTREISFQYTGGFPHAGVYHVVVWAEDINGRKAVSDVYPLTVGATPPPPLKPTNIRLAPTLIGQDGGFIATWDRVPSTVWTEYQVRVFTHHNYGFSPVYQQTGTTPFLDWTYDGPRFPIPGVYDVVVVARDIHGQETWSDPVPVTVQESVPPPLPPQNVRLDEPGPVWRSDRFKVLWDRVPNPKIWTTYKLQLRYHRAYGGAVIWESPAATKDTAAIYEGPALPQTGTFQAVIVAIDEANKLRSESAPLDVVVINPPPPPRPSPSSLSPSATHVEGPLMISWDRVQQPGVWTTYRLRVHYHIAYGFGLVWESPTSTETTYDIFPGPFPQAGTFSGVIVAEDSFGQRTESLPFDIPVQP